MDDIQRLSDLVNGLAEPDSLKDKLMLEGYESGRTGELLMEALTATEDKAKLEWNQLEHFIFGYCIGQYDGYVEGDVQARFNFNPDDETYH